MFQFFNIGCAFGVMTAGIKCILVRLPSPCLSVHRSAAVIDRTLAQIGEHLYYLDATAHLHFMTIPAHARLFNWLFLNRAFAYDTMARPSARFQYFAFIVSLITNIIEFRVLNLWTYTIITTEIYWNDLSTELKVL